MTRTLILGTLASVALAACSARPSLAPASEARRDDVRSHMRDHFSIAGQARDAVVRGDAALAQGALIWMSQHHYPPELAKDWEPYVTRMQRAARDARDTADLSAMAHAVARMGAECGNCHQALGRGPRMQTTQPVPDPTSQSGGDDPRALLRDRMRQHQWAADRLWEGLIGPWEAAFSEGCAQLREFRVSRELSAEQRASLAKIRALGECGTGSGAEPAERYAEIILECGTCHATFAVDPGAR